MAATGPSPSVAGFSARVVEASKSLPLRAFYLATGLRLLGHLVRAAAAAAGLRTQATVALLPAGIEVRSRTTLLGVTLRERHEVFPTAGVTAVARETCTGATFMAVGLIGLVTAIAFGVSTSYYGLVGRSASLLGTALAIVALGVLGDVALFFAAAGRRRLGIEQVRFAAAGRTYVLASVARKDAEAFVRGVTERLSEAHEQRARRTA